MHCDVFCGSFSTGTGPAVGPAMSATPRKRTQHQRIINSVDLDEPLQVDGVHRALRSSHPVKRTSTDALLIATGAAALAFATSAQAGAPFSCDPTFEARAQSGNLDPESKTWIIDTARRFYQDRSRDFPDMPPIGELRVQSIARIAGCAPRI